LSTAEKEVEGAEVFRVRVEEGVVLCLYWKILRGYGRISVVGLRISEEED
jgi:hypothetical protein